jgi:hypothetical protein
MHTKRALQKSLPSRKRDLLLTHTHTHTHTHISYAELRDGLKKFKIKLTEQEFDHITYSKKLCTKSQEINASRWETIMRAQMVMYCHRQV